MKASAPQVVLRKPQIARSPRPSELGRFENVAAVTRKVMQANKGRDTGPEMIVRRLVHAMGRRYRVHRSDLPGRPDLAYGPTRKAIFVHGCFWHRHEGCAKASMPKTRQDFWREKFDRNVDRDRRSEGQLRALGWDVLTVWECETRNPRDLVERLHAFLYDAEQLPVALPLP